MIVRAVYDETLITTQNYVLMIATADIFTYLSCVYRSLCVFSSMDAKEMKEMHFVHILNVYSTFIYRFGRIGSTIGRNVRYIIQ